jgi:RNA polymerase sigma-70 factor (ECF subfamily)
MKTQRPMQSDSSSSPALFARARAGSMEAIGELYLLFGQPLFALAYSLTGSREDAEDVVHDVFLGLPEALRHYEERGAGQSWLRRVTARVALTRLRSHRNDPVGLEHAERVSDPVPNASSMETALPRAIDSLPRHLRQVFLLREVEGYSHAEVAAFLEISVASSQVRLHRAIKLLRLRLDPKS